MDSVRRRSFGLSARRWKVEGIGDEAYLPTESSQPSASSRFPGSDEDKRWSRRPETPASEGTKTAGGENSVNVESGVGTARFLRSDRVVRSSDFKLLSQRGKRAAGRYFVILWATRSPREDLESTRIGITVSRKVGNAVVRNRVKRRIREWFRQDRHNLASTMDIVVIAKPAAAELQSPETWETLRQMTRRKDVDLVRRPEASGRGLK